jgi:hypothetical protein
MSLSVSTDVVCDEPHCGQWVAGVSGRQKVHAWEARHRAVRLGWSREGRGDGFVDLCPEHASKVAGRER